MQKTKNAERKQREPVHPGMSNKKSLALDIADFKDQILEQNAFLSTKEVNRGEFKNIQSLEDILKGKLDLLSQFANSDYKIIPKGLIDVGLYPRFCAKEIAPKAYCTMLASTQIVIVLTYLKELKKMNIPKSKEGLLEIMLLGAFTAGELCSYLNFSKYEKDILKSLKIEAGKNKNNAEYWAERLEQEYQVQPPKMPESTKKSNCYYIIDEEFEKVNQKEPPCHKTLARWWKKHYSQRF